MRSKNDIIDLDDVVESPRRTPAAPERPLSVRVTGIDVSFFSMMFLLIKISIASIPAAIIVFCFWFFVALFVGLPFTLFR